MRVAINFIIIAVVAVSGMPVLESDNGHSDSGILRTSSASQRPVSHSRSSTLRSSRGATRTSPFDTRLVDLNRNPSYYNYQVVTEPTVTDLMKRSWNSRARSRRSPQGFGLGRRFDGVDAGFPEDDILRPPRFRDDQPRHPERTPFSDHVRTECIEGGPSCTPKPRRKYFDFYS